jgi:hypothetical protein
LEHFLNGAGRPLSVRRVSVKADSG